MEVKKIADHGGNLALADTLFPDAPKPWIDLSTGINPHAYPFSAVPTRMFSRLPEPADHDRLIRLAAEFYGAPFQNIVATPGTQIVLPMLMRLMAKSRVAILSPTYAEHARAARLGGHDVHETSNFSELADATIAIIVNPNNPDGRIITEERLLDLARHMTNKGGLLIVDEAFMEAAPDATSLCSEAPGLSLIVLRSFGKFFGLAGIRLGFCIGPLGPIDRLSAELGPWAISGPALHIASEAISDQHWQEQTRMQLATSSKRLDTILQRNALQVSGGTMLFRHVTSSKAQQLHQSLGQAGILVRKFTHDHQVLRIGLPENENGFDRLDHALSTFKLRESLPA